MTELAGALRLGRGFHTWPDRQDLEADGVLCLGYANGKSGEHVHWPSQEAKPELWKCWVEDCDSPAKMPGYQCEAHAAEIGMIYREPLVTLATAEIRTAADEAKADPEAAPEYARTGVQSPWPSYTYTNWPTDDFPRAEVLWLVKRLERSEYERGQMKAENRRLLRRLRKLRHKRHH